MISQSPAPGPYVKEMNDAGQFYTNRVLKDFKEKYKILFNFLHDPFNHNSFFLFDRDKTHVEWVRAWIQVLVELQAFIKKYHTTGLTWNAKG